MKKIILCLISVLLFGLGGCGEADAEPVFSSPEAVTAEKLIAGNLCTAKADAYGAYSEEILSYEDGELSLRETIRCQKTDKGYLYWEEALTPDGYSYAFYGNSAEGNDLYGAEPDGVPARMKNGLSLSVTPEGIDTAHCIVESCEREGELYRVKLRGEVNGYDLEENLSLDPQTGLILSGTLRFSVQGKEMQRAELQFGYSESVEISDEIKQRYEEAFGETSEELISFTTETFGGETFDSASLSDAKLILVNFFEPWCGPCVGEMPDLETLYRSYKDRGLVVLGVFYSEDMDEELQAVLESTGVSYPVLRGCEALLRQTSQYVPTSFFMDGQGHIVGEQIIGSQSLEDWEAIVKELLE